MWKIIYNILTNISLPFFVVIAIFKKKLRKNIFERLFNTTKTHPIKDAVWVHAASIGEAVIGESLIKFIKRYRQNPHLNFLITTNTYYTKDFIKKKFGADIHIYTLPLDLSYVIRHFINGSIFKALIIIETEIWPNLIWTAKEKGIPVILINGRISDRTYPTYKRFAFFLKDVLSCIDIVIAQSELHRERFISIGAKPEKTIVTGNIKFYRDVIFNGEVKRENFITFGSIKEKELEAVFYVIKKIKETSREIKFFIVPRELHLITDIEDELKRYYNTMRYSLLKGESELKSLDNVDVVVVDTVGDLLDIYKKSKIAFVGGSLAPYGGQNILEPLFFETPVIFGPYVENFKEVADLIKERNAGIMVNNQEELLSSIRYLIDNPKIAQEMGHRGKEIIENHKAYMEKTVNLILNVIEKGTG